MTLADLHAERRRIQNLLPDFSESLALPSPPFGRFKFHHAQTQPWLLYASQQMLSFAIDSGYWAQIEARHPGQNKQAQWLEVLLSHQDPETGLFVCPVATASDTREGDQWDAAGYYRAITMKLSKRLVQLGVTPRHPLPKTEAVCPSLQDLHGALEKLGWDHEVYGAGSKAGAWAVVRMQELADDGTAEDDPYVMTIVRFLESIQNPRTGFWGTGPDPIDSMNGLFKSFEPFRRLDRPLPMPDRIIDSVLSVQDPEGKMGDSCSPWNALTLLSHLTAWTSHRRGEIRECGLRLCAVLDARRQPDGLYSAMESGCVDVHAGVVLCDGPKPVSDLQGTGHTLAILKMAEALFADSPGDQQ